MGLAAAQPADDVVVATRGVGLVEGLTRIPDLPYVRRESGIGRPPRIQRVQPGEHVEVIAKEVAASASDMTFDPPPDEIIEDDPVVAYVYDLGPGASLDAKRAALERYGTDVIARLR